jgi:NAD(P)H-dependent flavin oxidoreductase YrpB (nitropropane dioxygenase family)
MYSMQEGVMDYMGLAGDADAERSFMPAGQGMGLIRSIKPAAEVMADLIAEAETALTGLVKRTS